MSVWFQARQVARLVKLARKPARLAQVLALTAAAGHAQVKPPSYTVISQDTSIQITTDPTATGWKVASDTAAITVQTRLALTVTFSAGGNLYRAQDGAAIPIQVSARAYGKGAWGSGGPFNVSAPNWTAWQGWLEPGQQGTVSFLSNQALGLQFRAQVNRHGLNDPAGAYGQTVPMVVTIAAN